MILKGNRIFYFTLTFSAALHLLLFLLLPYRHERQLVLTPARETPAVSLYLAPVAAVPKSPLARPRLKPAAQTQTAAPVPEAAQRPAEPKPDIVPSVEESPTSPEPKPQSQETEAPIGAVVTAPQSAESGAAIGSSKAVEIASAPIPQATASAAETPGYRQLLEALRARIVDNIRYPPLARSRGWKGTVLLLASLDAQGRLQELTVQKSSGHSVLDQAAAALVRRVTPIGNPLGRPLAIEIPIVYELKDR